MKVIKQFDVAKCITHRLLTFSILSIMMNDNTSFDQEHIALTN